MRPHPPPPLPKQYQHLILFRHGLYSPYCRWILFLFHRLYVARRKPIFFSFFATPKLWVLVSGKFSVQFWAKASRPTRRKNSTGLGRRSRREMEIWPFRTGFQQLQRPTQVIYVLRVFFFTKYKKLFEIIDRCFNFCFQHFFFWLPSNEEAGNLTTSFRCKFLRRDLKIYKYVYRSYIYAIYTVIY